MVRLSGLFAAIALCGLFTSPVAAAPPSPLDDLVKADRATLETLYAQGAIAIPPPGFAPGRAIPDPGSRNTSRRSKRMGLLWKGKVFSDDQMINRLVGGRDAVTARVFVGESFLDGKPSVIFDYAGSRRFGDVRDEVREISPGIFLGVMYVRKNPAEPKLSMFFALDANARK